MKTAALMDNLSSSSGSDNDDDDEDPESYDDTTLTKGDNKGDKTLTESLEDILTAISGTEDDEDIEYMV